MVQVKADILKALDTNGPLVFKDVCIYVSGSKGEIINALQDLRRFQLISCDATITPRKWASGPLCQHGRMLWDEISRLAIVVEMVV